MSRTKKLQAFLLNMFIVVNQLNLQVQSKLKEQAFNEESSNLTTQDDCQNNEQCAQLITKGQSFKKHGKETETPSDSDINERKILEQAFLEQMKKTEKAFASIFNTESNLKNQQLPIIQKGKPSSSKEASNSENISDFAKLFTESTTVDDVDNQSSKLKNGLLANDDEKVTEKVPVLTIPLNMQNILTLLLIVVLTVIGTIYIWILSQKKHCRCRLCNQEFVLEECIGEGGFGAVYIVHKNLTNGEIVKYILKKLEMKDITDLDKVQYEAKQLRMLHHKYIVTYEDEFLHINEGAFDNKYIYVIIMEYCVNGDLTDKIRDYRDQVQELHPNNISMPEHKIMKYFIEVCEALKYIHQRDIIHRDIKSPNIFITDDDCAKLGDFGLCIQGKTIETKAKYSTVGTNCYMAPELIKGQLHQKGKSSDVWAMGLVLLEMVMGNALWDLQEDFGIKSIQEPHYLNEYINLYVPEKYNSKLKTLLKKMLNADPQKRICIEEIMKKKFIRQWQHKLKLDCHIQTKKIKTKQKNNKDSISSKKSSKSKLIEPEFLLKESKNNMNRKNQQKSGNSKFSNKESFAK